MTEYLGEARQYISNVAVLEGAIEVLENDGWAQSKWGFSGEPKCMEGAMAAAMGYNNPTSEIYVSSLNSCPAFIAVSRYLVERGEVDPDPDLGRLYDYNDAKHRTKSDVIKVLREVAEIERQKEVDSPMGV